ncbi:MAG: hypothetical protein ACXAC7_14380 [Candidatus Hodarchaeales archaeon]
MNKRFMLRSLKSLTANSDKFEEDFSFSSPLGDSMVIKIRKGEQQLTLSTEGESDISLKLTGDEQLLKEFVHDFTVEAATIIAAELSLCLRKAFPEITIEKLRKHFRLYMTEAINKAISDCKC